MNSTGQPVSKASVMLIRTNGTTRFALTNQFGYFKFDELPVGESYVINASHKQYQFPWQTIMLFESIDDLIFTPN